MLLLRERRQPSDYNCRPVDESQPSSLSAGLDPAKCRVFFFRRAGTLVPKDAVASLNQAAVDAKHIEPSSHFRALYVDRIGPR